MYHVVIGRDGMRPEHEQFKDHDKLVNRLVELTAEEAWVYVIEGWQHKISKAPFRFLIAPDDQTYPLFQLPSSDALEIADDGYVGPPQYEDDAEVEDGSYADYDDDDDDAVEITASAQVTAAGVYEPDDDFQLEDVVEPILDDDDADDLYVSDDE